LIAWERGIAMQALIIIASLLAAQPAPAQQPSPLSNSPPLSAAELASATAAGAEAPRVVAAPQTTTTLSLDFTGQTGLPSIRNLVSNTDPQSVAQAETEVNLLVTLRRP
jgi:hypothetical protein